MRAAFLVLAACSSKFDAAEVTDDPHTHRLELSGAVKSTLVVDNRELAKVETNASSVEVGPFKPSEWIAMRDRVKARVDTNCGPTMIDVLRTDLTQYRFDTNKLSVIEATVHVDNEGRPAGKLEIGRQTHALPANEVLAVKLVFGSCPEARTVKVDGTQVGTLEPATKHPYESYLVDVTGKHCYWQHEVVYYADAEAAKKSPAPKNTTFEGKQVHELFASFWFEDPPAKMTDFANTGRETFKRVIRCQ